MFLCYETVSCNNAMSTKLQIDLKHSIELSKFPLWRPSSLKIKAKICTSGKLK